ncbi:hypothetical protein BDV12DRAFT_202684 [Aspergillus spectabilis]
MDLTTPASYNPDFVDISVNLYQNRLLFAQGDRAFVNLANTLDTQPVITIPSVALELENSAVLKPANASAAAKFFIGPRYHYQVPSVRENIPCEAPETFANAIFQVTQLTDSDTHRVGI